MEPNVDFQAVSVGFRNAPLPSRALLKERFCASWGSDDVAWSILEQLYGQRHRHFHTLTHIAECLTVADQYAVMVSWPELPQELELALWFHDAFYEPSAKNNEERSAELFESLAVRVGHLPHLVEATVALIQETKDHDGSGVQLAGVMSDCDLWILGSSNERYDDYRAQIRQEYAAVPALQFRWGRIQFLRHMLKRRHIFTNPLFEDAFGEQARSNLKRELLSLTFKSEGSR